MKFIRILSTLFVLAILLAFIAVAFAFLPDLQTWVAQTALARHPELHASLGTLSVGLDEIDMEEVHLEKDGAVLTLPTLSAKLPLLAGARGRKISLRSLVAKDWILDLSHARGNATVSPPTAPPAEEGSEATPPSSASPDALPSEQVALVFKGLLSDWKLPYNLSADGIDLEGDVIIPEAGGKEQTRVHVKIQGGGFAIGHEGTVTVDATETFLGAQIVDLALHGNVVAAMDTSRTFNRVEVKADLSAKVGTSPAGLNVSADLTATRVGDDETYSVDLSRGDRHLAVVRALLDQAKHRLTGTWSVDWQNSDLGPLVEADAWPTVAAKGQGEIDSDTGFTRVHALGGLNVTGDRLSVLSPALASLGNVDLDTEFGAALSGNSLKVDRLRVSLGGVQPIAVVQALQVFDLDVQRGTVTAADPQTDLVKCSVNGFPLKWLPSIPGGFTLGGDATGEFILHFSAYGFSARAPTPFTARNVSVQRAGTTIAKDLELSLSLSGEKTAQGWQVQCAPMTVGRDGRQLGHFEGTGAQLVGKDQPITIAGKWNADFAALASAAIPKFSANAIRSAGGDFSATLAAESKMESDLKLVEQDADHSVAVKLSAEVGSDNEVTFHAPLKLAVGSAVSELSVEGTWAGTENGNEMSVSLAAKEMDPEHLSLLSSPLALIMSSASAEKSAAKSSELPALSERRDTAPFWGTIVGDVNVGFDRFKEKGGDLLDVHGNFRFDHTSIRLQTGQYRVGELLGAADGSLSYNPDLKVPYTLKGTLDGGQVDAASFFPPPAPEGDPVFHGHFSLTSTLTGSGLNLSDLLAHAQQEFQLKSSGGIVRLLKTEVGSATEQPSDSRVGDAATTVGSLVGKLAGMQQKTIGSGDIHLSKTTQAVIDFSYDVAEIGYDEIDITAREGIDGVIHVTKLDMTAPDERATGAGEIDVVKNGSLGDEPLSVDLKFGFRGKTAERLVIAGLLSTEKDNQGYTLLKQSVHFGGTLQHLDISDWHDLLAKAAGLKAELDKK